jgi:hypothetical protein
VQSYAAFFMLEQFTKIKAVLTQLLSNFSDGLTQQKSPGLLLPLCLVFNHFACFRCLLGNYVALRLSEGFIKVRWGVASCRTYVTPSLNHAGRVITTSGVFLQKI